MKALGKTYDETEVTGTFERLPAGGYVCKILDVKDDADHNRLELVFDIEEGPHKGFYSDEWGKDHPFAHTIKLFYTEKALGIFKRNLKAIDESNGTSFVQQAVTGLKEKELVGKICGILIGYREFNTDRGETRQVVDPRTLVSVEKIRSGNFNIPELRKITPSAPAPVAGFENISDADIPF